TDRWQQIFDFRDADATWGLVALDQDVSRVPLLDTVQAALNGSTLQVASGPASPATSVPPAGGDGGRGSTPPPTTTTTTAPTSPTTTQPPGSGGTVPDTGIPIVDDTLQPVDDVLGGLLK